MENINSGLLIAPNPMLYNLKADIFDLLDQTDLALKFYDISLRMNPADFMNHYKQGLILQDIG